MRRKKNEGAAFHSVDTKIMGTPSSCSKLDSKLQTMQVDTCTGIYNKEGASSAINDFVSKGNTKKHCTYCQSNEHKITDCIKFLTNNKGVEPASQLIPGDYSFF